MEVTTKKKSIWKKTLLIVSALFVVFAFLLIIYPSYHSVKKLEIRYYGHKNLEKLIEAQDSYFQSNGKYLALDPATDNTNTKQLLNWCTTDCSPCKYGVTVSNNNFTATVKCPLEDGTFNYLGYVRVAPGSHSGIDGAFGKCLAKGIHAGSRHLVNNIGPCFEQDNGIMFVISGSKKHLVVKTFPGNASISANGTLIGETSSQHNNISPKYGSFYWSAPYTEPVTINITKSGYHPVEFPLEWGSYTYTSTIVLKPIKN